MAEADAAQEALDLVGRDPRAALEAADAIVASLPRPRTPEDVRQVAVAHRAAGLALRTFGEPAQAERRLRRGLAVADRAGAVEVAAEVRMTLAFVLLDLGRYRAALAATDHALSVLRGVRAARVRTIRALVLHRTGRFREAYAEYDAALRVLVRSHDDVWQARLRHNRSLMSTELGDTDSALRDLAWSRRYYLDNGDTLDATDALFNMGVALEQSGDIPGALALFDQAEAEWVDVERPELWMARVDAYLGVGLVDEALLNARTAVAWLEGRSWDGVEAHTRLQLATCLLLSDPPDHDGAQSEAERARSMFARAERTEAVAQSDYVLLTARIRQRPTARDLGRITDAAARLRDTGGDAQAADLRITGGRACLASGDLVRARTLLGPLTGLERAGQLEVRSRAWLARALLADADGDATAADAALRRAWAVVEQQRGLLGATELRAASATHATAVVELGLDLALRSASPERVFGWAERGRAASLRFRSAVAPRDPELATALSRLRWAARAEEESRLDGEGTPSRHLLARSEADVRRLSHRDARATMTRQPATVAEIRSTLDGERFVHLVRAQDRMWAVVIGRGRPRLLDLGAAAATEDAVGSLRFGLRRLLTGFGTSQGLRATAEAVGVAAGRLDELLAPALGPADDGPLVVCPSGALTGVPWAALPSLAARPLSVAPSGALWCAARSVPRPARPEVVAVAGPGLLGAEAEVDGVVRVHARARRLSGAEAQVGAVLDAAATASVLHLAAHGRLRTDNPLFSALELADGPLTGYELESLAHVPETIVLSACSSGEGRAATAEETLGLSWTLLALGAAAVVAPLLPVPDQATTELMVGLHRELAAGSDASAALATAQAAYRADPMASAVASAFVAFGA